MCVLITIISNYLCHKLWSGWKTLVIPYVTGSSLVMNSHGSGTRTVFRGPDVDSKSGVRMEVPNLKLDDVIGQFKAHDGGGPSEDKKLSALLIYNAFTNMIIGNMCHDFFSLPCSLFLPVISSFTIFLGLNFTTVSTYPYSGNLCHVNSCLQGPFIQIQMNPFAQI